MRGEGFKLATVAMSLGLVTAACTSSTSGPATAPSITEPPATAPTTTSPPSTTSTSMASTTTVDRVAEVEAIFKDLELRRLDALFREDEEAFRTAFASDGYFAASLPVLGELDFSEPPTADNVVVAVNDIIIDRSDCLVIVVTEDLTSILADAEPLPQTFVLTTTETGSWGYAFGGTGWQCDGPNPHES